MGLLSFSTFYTEDLVEGHDVRPIYYLINELTAAYGVFVMLPGILWFINKYRFTRSNWLFMSPLHLVASIAGGILHTLIMTGSRLWLYRVFDLEPYRMGDPFYRFLMEYQKQALVYGAILVAFYLVSSYRESRQKEEKATELKLQAAQLESRLKESQLQLLKGQLQPHFLFNTLNMISSLMYEDVSAADEMMSKLSHLLRVSLEHTDRDRVPMRQELQFTESYLEIMRSRFQDRLSYQLEVDEKVLDAFVPAFLLQPLVENAIKHGDSGQGEPLQVTLAAYKEGEGVAVEVKDNGPGNIENSDEVTEGLGLSNTRRRLEGLYGDNHRFEVGNLPGGGFGTKVWIPLPAGASSEES